jgi:hypothetical protein
MTVAAQAAGLILCTGPQAGEDDRGGEDEEDPDRRQW